MTTTSSRPSLQLSDDMGELPDSAVIRRPRSDATGVPSAARSGPDQPRPLTETARDIGWLILVIGSTGTLLVSWIMFPLSVEGMWAGYWVSATITTALLAAIWLRSSPTPAVIAATVVSGLILILLGALRDYTPVISTTMVTGGAFIVVGALMQAVHHWDDKQSHTPNTASAAPPRG